MKWIEVQDGGFLNLYNITYIQVDFFRIIAFPNDGEPIRILKYFEHEIEDYDNKEDRNQVDEVNSMSMDIVERVEVEIDKFLRDPSTSYLSIPDLVTVIKNKIKSEFIMK